MDTPAAYGDTHTLNIQVSWANTAADFDVYVLDEAGTVVKTAASHADPEQVVLPPTAGDYTVRVVPYASRRRVVRRDRHPRHDAGQPAPRDRHPADVHRLRGADHVRRREQRR